MAEDVIAWFYSFLDGTSSTYLEELEERYRADPSSVDKTWASFFKSLGETE
jgi:2-oxoglutarate dehydrogenase E1 component